METKKIRTPSGAELELKTSLTFGEVQEINATLAKEIEIEYDEYGRPKTPKVSADLLIKLEKKEIEKTIISVNGEKENILEKIESLDGKDYNFIILEVKKITKLYGFEEKKNFREEL